MQLFPFICDLLGEIIIPNDKYRMEEIDVNTYTTRLRLHLKLSSSADEGGYKCCSKNSIGDSEGTITVYGKLYAQPLCHKFDSKI